MSGVTVSIGHYILAAIGGINNAIAGLTALFFLYAIVNEVDKLRKAGSKGKTFIESFFDWLKTRFGGNS